MYTQIKDQVIHYLKNTLPELTSPDLELPKKIEHGHLALPVFSLAKNLRKSPNQIATEFVQKISQTKPDFIETVTPVGGYLNFTLKNEFMQKHVENSIFKNSEKFGFSKSGIGKKVVIDYSSPNVAKPMSIGHMRATMIGNAIRNLAESQGFNVLGLNYLGDWGVQFGKLAWAYQNWGHEYSFKEKPFESLFNLYVRFHAEAETNPELDAKGSQVFKKLEEGDPEIEKLWKLFIDISLKEYHRIYGMLNIKFDLIQGESFHNKDLEPTVQLLQKKGLLHESEGAQVVFLDNDKPPCIIKKSDGASLYATRDLASALYRRNELKADKLIYVVGVDQTLHFQQVFEVLLKLGHSWAEDCHHIAFGMYRFKNMGKMSTRKGQVVFMDDVLNRSIELAESIIQEKNPDLKNKTEVARKVGIGAIVFHDLVGDRIKNVDFDWDKVLDFEGDSGPYVQYCIVRCRSILRKTEVKATNQVVLTEPEERELIRQLLNYDQILRSAWGNFKPNLLAQYILDTCKLFNQYYAKHKILTGDPSLLPSRLMLIKSTEKILVEGLRILGIEAPEEM